MGEQGPVSLPLWCPNGARFLEAVSFSFNIFNLVGEKKYYRHHVLVGGGKFGVVGHQFLEHLFLVDCGGGKVVEVSFESLHAHLIAAVFRLRFACFWGPSRPHSQRQTCPTLQWLVLLSALWRLPSCKWFSSRPRFYVTRINPPSCCWSLDIAPSWAFPCSRRVGAFCRKLCGRLVPLASVHPRAY